MNLNRFAKFIILEENHVTDAEIYDHERFVMNPEDVEITKLDYYEENNVADAEIYDHESFFMKPEDAEINEPDDSSFEKSKFDYKKFN